MLTSQFDYDLPERLIAQEPVRKRDISRMMVIDRKRRSVSHSTVKMLPDILASGDLLVTNDTKVVPARVSGRKKTGGGLEILFVEELSPNEWEVLIKASRRPKPGVPFEIADGMGEAEILEDGEMGRAIIAVRSSVSMDEIFASAGSTPLPPYIKRSAGDSRGGMDAERYQTVYAEQPGAVAAPTAGLHFTQDLFSRLKRKGIGNTRITLHVGPGTFRPVSCEHLEEHVMDAERYKIPQDAATAINACVGRRVAVGSTSVRTLETVAAERGAVVPCEGRSRLFVYPPYKFIVVDAMLTNFHLPRSTLLMMVCAFGGQELIMRAYREAVEKEYRFYSYGDCMLIL